MRLQALILCLFALVTGRSIAGAQQQQAPRIQGSLPIERGSRVRVRADILVAPLIANYLELRSDTLILFEESAGRGMWSVPLTQVRQLETSVGQRNSYRPYIVTGALVGTGAGAIGGLLFAATFSPSNPERKYSRPLSAAVGAIVGAVAGGIVGSRLTAEQWAQVPLPRRVSLVPAGHGIVRVAVGY